MNKNVNRSKKAIQRKIISNRKSIRNRKPSIVILPMDDSESLPVSPSEITNTNELRDNSTSLLNNTHRLNVDIIENDNSVNRNATSGRRHFSGGLISTSGSDSDDGTTDLTDQTSTPDEYERKIPISAPLTPTTVGVFTARWDETYTDKDRAAAVASGTKDIKVSLQIKRKEEIRRMIPGEKGASVFYSQGMFQYQKGTSGTQKAINYFNSALEMQPNSLRCLLARALCHLDAGKIDYALADVNSALELDSNYPKALGLKAEVLYQQGLFEDSLLLFHRASTLRADLSKFRTGISKCEEAIYNVVGREENDCKAKSRLHNTDNKLSDKLKPTRLENSREINADRIYLTNLLGEKALCCQRNATTRQVRLLVQEANGFLQNRQIFWQKQDPKCINPRMPQRRGYSKKKKNKLKSKKISINNTELELQRQMDSLENERWKLMTNEERLQSCFELVDRLEKSPLSSGPLALCRAYSLLGNAHLEAKNYEEAIFYHQQDLELAEKENLFEAHSRALDNLGQTHAKSKCFEKAIECWKKRLEYSSSTLEEACLCNEIGRCQFELGLTAEAKEFGQRSQKIAQGAKITKWVLFSTILVAQTEAKLGNLSKSIKEFENALLVSQKRRDRTTSAAILETLRGIQTRIEGDKK